MVAPPPKERSKSPKPSKIGPCFKQVASQVHFRPAPDASSDARSERTLNPQDPDLVLLFTWTSARFSHIAKYTSKYTNLYPEAAIMVITTSFKDLFCCSAIRKQRSLNPALRILLAEKLTTNILLHCFSEGGSMKACQFAKVYHKTTGTRLQVSSLCLDSTPGTMQPSQIPSMWRTIAPKNLAAKALSSATGHAFTAAYQIRTKYLFAETRRALDDDTLWDTKAPRCYLYSEADQLVGYQGIVEHARNATKRGTPVNEVRFESSGHCAHTKENPDKYWAAVQKTWNSRTTSGAMAMAMAMASEERLEALADAERLVAAEDDEISVTDGLCETELEDAGLQAVVEEVFDDDSEQETEYSADFAKEIEVDRRHCVTVTVRGLSPDVGKIDLSRSQPLSRRAAAVA